MLPTPHLEKLRATLNNTKLPAADRPRIELAIERYHRWITAMKAVKGAPEEIVATMVGLLNDYKRFVDVEVIFDSDSDFLYRQKGQLKLDNSVVEEFLPWLLRAPIVPEWPNFFATGPTNCYAAIYFDSSLRDQRPGAGIRVRTKDQDFALARKLYIRASHSPDFSDAAEVSTYIAYVATEIKTNLDKTMFQEACATARDLRMAVPGARYFLLCEWLDMTPTSTAPTDIEEVLILRGAKRLGSNVRKHFGNSTARRERKQEYVEFLDRNPFRADMFQRWVEHIAAMRNDGDLEEDDVLKQGYF